jgi:hypothetical protein
MKNIVSPKHGVCTQTFQGVIPALVNTRATWVYSWLETMPAMFATLPSEGVQYVPMVSRTRNLERALSLQWVRKYLDSQPTIMAFNEIDRPDQADMSPQVAVDNYAALIEMYGRQDRVWVSPSVSANAERAGGPFETFMTLAERRKLPVDAISIHTYPGWRQAANFRPRALANAALKYIDSVHAKYQRPIWVTEMAVVDFSTPGGPTWASVDVQREFMQLLLPELQNRSFVDRYAWFRLQLKEDDRARVVGLADTDTGDLTPLGAEYARLA